jgi:hypothetical protein
MMDDFKLTHYPIAGSGLNVGGRASNGKLEFMRLLKRHPLVAAAVLILIAFVTWWIGERPAPATYEGP